MDTLTERADGGLTGALRASGRRVTSQRLVIHRALRELARHAPAEEVLAAAGRRLPGLSLPTVYATLDLLVELGLVRRVRPGAGPVLFDPRAEPHHHAVCRSCGRVDDLEAPVGLAPALEAARAAGFHPEHAELVVGGRCAACAAGPPSA